MSHLRCFLRALVSDAHRNVLIITDFGEGHLKTARQFIADKAPAACGSPGGTTESVVPPGLREMLMPYPGNELPGYFQVSLRDRKVPGKCLP
ncbi:hypothetical protein QUF80_00590 [Desulfococcaceae bacterium HSG8]|nr:hypothetical protein [Desulfococcaceae bacterium HSG8]